MSRSRFIDVLRGISISLVLLHHFNIAYSLRDTALAHLTGWTFLHALVRNGNYGVTMFFVISGFLITSNAQARFQNLACVAFGSFYRYRAGRVLPGVILLVVVVNVLAAFRIDIFLNHPEGGGTLPFWLGNLASLTFWMNVLMVREGWFNYVLCVLWSLSVEEVFYLGFPILCRLLKRERALVAVWMVFIVVGPIWRALHQDDENQFLFAYLACFDGIAFGCCAALLRSRLRLAGGAAMALHLGAIGLVFCVYFWGSIGSTNIFGVTLVAAGTAVMILTHTSSGRQPAFVGAWFSRGLGWAGRLSLELYLFHLVVLGGLRSLWSTDTTSSGTRLILLAAYLVLSGMVAVLISRFYSAPLNRMARVGKASSPFLKKRTKKLFL